jgi:hypothetical protein
VYSVNAAPWRLTQEIIMTMHHLVPNATPNANRFSKTRRPLLEPISNPKNNPHFEKLPITNNVNLTLPLGVIVPQTAAAATSSGKLVFHVIGDSGGIHGDDVQGAVAEAMESQIKSALAADKPAFLYHVGDVVFFNGQSALYGSQFYEPYQYFPAPIFAFPGTMMATPRVRAGDAPDTEPSLYGFTENFCAPQPHQISAYRATATNLTSIGHWTPRWSASSGSIPMLKARSMHAELSSSRDGGQQLANVKSKDGFIIIAVHHPPIRWTRRMAVISISSSLLTRRCKRPALFRTVLSGHVHNVRRFTRR